MAQEVEEVEEALECVSCDATEEEKALFVCSKCPMKKTTKYLCQSCGEYTHSHKNHSFNDYKTSAKLVTALYTPTETQLQKYLSYGKQKLIQAVGTYVTDGNLETLQKSISSANAFAVGVVQGKTGAVGVGSAICDLANDFAQLGIKGVYQQATNAGALSTVLQTTKGIAKTSAGVSVCIMGAEMIYLGVQFCRGKITWGELGRRVCRSVVVNATVCACNIGGCVTGAAIGACFGPIGAVIGAVIGGVIGSVGGSIGASKLFEKYWPAETQNQREEEIQAAMKQFFYNKESIKDKTKFNKKLIENKYHRLAKLCHPDRIDGDEAAFRELGLHYGILINMAESLNGNKNASRDDTISMILSITMPGFLG